MTLTQALIERAYFAALCVANIWHEPAPVMEKLKISQAKYKARAIVAYDRAYDLAMGKGRK